MSVVGIKVLAELFVKILGRFENFIENGSQIRVHLVASHIRLLFHRP
jgi:hypothetical protein